MFIGSIVALVTPLKDNYIDIEAICRLVTWHIEQGTHGIVVCGSTGEGMLLSPDEQKEVITTCVQTAAGRIPIIANINTLQMQELIPLCITAQEAGVNGLMVNPPPYIKPTQRAILDFLKNLHDSIEIPLILYDNPSRSGVSLTENTVRQLAELPRFVAIKNSTGNLTEVAKITVTLPNLIQLCGDDALNAAFLAQGAQGWISVTANIMPYLCAELYNTWCRHDLKSFAFLRNALVELNTALFIEASPAPTKYLLSRQGFCQNEIRYPLSKASEEVKHTLDQVFHKAQSLEFSYKEKGER